VIRSLAVFAVHSALAILILFPLALLLTTSLIVVWPLFFTYDSILTTSISRVIDVGTVAVVAVVAWVVTVAFVFLVGLPIRISGRPHRWWVRHGAVAIVGAVSGAAMLVFAWAFSTIEDYEGYKQVVPNGWLLLAGWLLFSFCLTHVWWPGRRSYEVREDSGRTR
jgi:hypothetical protein